MIWLPLFSVPDFQIFFGRNVATALPFLSFFTLRGTTLFKELHGTELISAEDTFAVTVLM
jgi:hypothetical protein